MEWVKSLPTNLKLEMLQHMDERIREAAAETLLEESDFLAVESLMAALQDRSEYVREIAARTLGKIGDARAVTALIMALDDESVSVRRAAVEALERIGDKRALDHLVTALRDKTWIVRGAAARALDKLDPNWPQSEAAQKQVPYFIAELQDENRSVRWWAAETLGNIGDPRALSPIITSLEQDKDKDVRRAAARALGKIGEANAVRAKFAHGAEPANGHRHDRYVHMVSSRLKQLLGWDSDNNNNGSGEK